MNLPIASINLVSADIDFLGSADRCANLHRASSLGELKDILAHCQTDDALSPASLDLIGHSTRGHHLLRLGDTPVDMLDAHVMSCFRQLAETGILAALQVASVRLLGCETAVTESGQRTLRMLSRMLRVPVFGTCKPLYRSHYDAAGFNPVFSHILVEASDTYRSQKFIEAEKGTSLIREGRMSRTGQSVRSAP